MTKLHSYMDDGANYQAQAVLAFLRHFDVESSWDKETHDYRAQITIARWENCREQGYVLSLYGADLEQINIAFFEHRNTDSICAVKWIQSTLNAPTIDTAEFGDIYRDKYQVSHSVDYGKVVEMADWIKKELETFWKKSTKEQKTNEQKQ